MGCIEVEETIIWGEVMMERTHNATISVSGVVIFERKLVDIDLITAEIFLSFCEMRTSITFSRSADMLILLPATVAFW